MTRMHTAGFKSNLVHLCHWPSVNDTNAHWSMTQMHTAGFKTNSVHLCHWPMVNDTNARWGLSREGQSSLLREWSMTPMHTSGCKSHSMVNDTNGRWSMTWMHTAGCNIHPVGKPRVWFRHGKLLLGVIYTWCIRVIDRLYTMHGWLQIDTEWLSINLSNVDPTCNYVINEINSRPLISNWKLCQRRDLRLELFRSFHLKDWVLERKFSTCSSFTLSI